MMVDGDQLEEHRRANLLRLETMFLNLKARIINLPRRNVGGYLDVQIREVLADIDSIEDRVATAMQAPPPHPVKEHSNG